MDVDEREPIQAKKRKYAAAIRYRQGKDEAPVVVASGKGQIAELIVKIATEAGVPNHTEPGLAKILAQLEPGTPIPEETYQMVASILAFIWRLDKNYNKTAMAGVNHEKGTD
jgi:flagellar biosynthesis protein